MERAIEDLNLRTAGFNCFCRAYAAERLGNRPGSDRLSWIFLPRMIRYLFRFGLWRCILKRQLGPPGTFSFVVGRTLAIDSVYQSALQRGVSQVVIMGAGFDTRALRLEKLLKASVFELDLDQTQQFKRRRLDGFHVSIPENLHFLPIDFERDSLEKRLAGSGFDLSQSTLFIMEGLTMYLRKDVVLDALRFIREKAASGSEAVFDVLHSSLLTGESKGYGADEMWRLLVEHQSPFHFTADPDEMSALLGQMGLHVQDTWEAEEFAKLLTGLGSGIGQKVAGYLTLFHVRN